MVSRGLDYGASRWVCNVHWYSDTIASRVFAAATLARLQTSPDFLKDLEAARAELSSVTRLLHRDLAEITGRLFPLAEIVRSVAMTVLFFWKLTIEGNNHLNRPKTMNALSKAMRSRLFNLIKQVNANPDVRAIILTGSGDKPRVLISKSWVVSQMH